MKNVHVSSHPLVRHKLTTLRDKETKPKKFRELIREISILLAYEATTTLQTQPVEIETPLVSMTGETLSCGIGLVPILRAGLGMVEGIWELIPGAEVWHIGLRRDEKTLEPVHYYAKKPIAPLVSDCLVLDPMLATGGTVIATCDMLKEWGVSRISYIGLIASPEGVKRLSAAHPDIPMFLGNIDEKLNENGYIVPGLGDAGDRQFGTA